MAIKIAAILTCFNRREKTVKCLDSLFRAENQYNHSHDSEELCVTVYLTDDACSDGTADAVRGVCKGRELHILQGDGHCYWAGGMLMAWKKALTNNEHWQDY